MTTKNQQEVEEALTIDREEHLYHESARELARMIVELESKVEGLETQLHDAEGDAIKLSEERDEAREAATQLANDLGMHERRYAGAVKMIQRRQEQLTLQRKAYVLLAKQFKERGEKYSALVQKIAELNNSVRDLHNVNTVDLDDAISALANAFDTALLS